MPLAMNRMRVRGLSLVAPLLFTLACSKTDPPAPAPSESAAPEAASPSPTLESPDVAPDAAVKVSALRVLTLESVPKNVGVIGKVEKVIGWTDKNGENVAVFSRTSATSNKGKPFVRADGPYESAYLHVLHVVTTEPLRVLREVKDKEEGCDADLSVHFREGANAVTDLDGDGIGELTFAYSLNCASDMSPATLKLLMLENGEKYILRGTTRIAPSGADTAPMGGAYHVDASFKDAPPAFLEHAKASWLKVRAH